MVTFLSQEWFATFIDEINSSDEYKQAAADWEGDVAFLVEAEPDHSFHEPVWAVLELRHGRCRGGGIVDAQRGELAPYLIRAPYSRWKDVVLGQLDPIRGMMQGRLKLRGDLPTILRYVRAANELVFLTGKVPTEFPDEV
jgi:putative sterol carrier protein